MTGEEIRDTTDTSVSLEGKAIFMSGGSRGIGLAIARRAPILCRNRLQPGSSYGRKVPD